MLSVFFFFKKVVYQVDVSLVVHPGAKDQGTGHVHNVLRRHVTQRAKVSYYIILFVFVLIHFIHNEYF